MKRYAHLRSSCIDLILNLIRDSDDDYENAKFLMGQLDVLLNPKSSMQDTLNIIFEHGFTY